MSGRSDRQTTLMPSLSILARAAARSSTWKMAM